MKVDRVVLFQGRALCLAAFLAAICLVFLPARSFAERADTEGAVTIQIEAESYWWSHNVAGEAISKADHDGRGFVVGVDYPDEWIMLTVKVAEPIFFRIGLHAAEDNGLRVKYGVEFVPLGPGVVPAGDTLASPPGRGAC